MNSDTKTKAQPQDSEETEAETDKARFEKDYILETGSVLRTKGVCLDVILLNLWSRPVWKHCFLVHR